MFKSIIISNELLIYKFLQLLNFDFYLMQPQSRHLESIMKTMVSKGFKGKTSDIVKLALARYRTSITRFLSISSLDKKLLEKSLKAYIIELIWTKSKKSR